MTWQQHAACAGMPVDLFFPVEGDTGEQAKRVCAVCPVADECLDAGLFEQHGIWGGLSPSQRRYRRSKWRVPAQRALGRLSEKERMRLRLALRPHMRETA